MTNKHGGLTTRYSFILVRTLTTPYGLIVSNSNISRVHCTRIKSLFVFDTLVYNIILSLSFSTVNFSLEMQEDRLCTFTDHRPLTGLLLFAVCPNVVSNVFLFPSLFLSVSVCQSVSVSVSPHPSSRSFILLPLTLFVSLRRFSFYELIYVNVLRCMYHFRRENIFL